MSVPPVAVDILSDSDDAFSPVINKPHLPCNSRIGTVSPILLLDDDPTPTKPSAAKSTPSFVAETPLGFGSDVSFVPCSLEKTNPSCSSDKFSAVSGLILVESDNDSDLDAFEKINKEPVGFSPNKEENLSVLNESFGFPLNKEENNEKYDHDILNEDFSTEISQDLNEERNLNQEENTSDDNKKLKGKTGNSKKRQSKEEKARLVEERKRKRQEEKLEREAKKLEAKEMKKLEKEKNKWEKGKLALKSIFAQIDSKVIESGLLGGHLVTRFAEKGFSYHITKNPIEKSIIWTINVPNELAQHSSVGIEVQYIVIIFQAEEFCHLVNNNLLMDHLNKVQKIYPSYTICYVTNKLMSYIKKSEQSQYKNPSSSNTWRRPPVDEVTSKLCTHYMQVHSRHCIDEAELAEHIVGLTSSLANCQFRKKLTWLSVNANGSIVPKDATEKNLIKKNTWLKALVSIPKVQPRHAIAIWKKYPTMRSLLNIYMDKNKSVHEKEFLLKDLMMEGILGNGERRLGEVCSKRVYRVLTAQSGGIQTDDVENGADFF